MSHYRRAADTIVEAPDGTMQIWNGIDSVLHFDANLGTLETAGVIAPVNVITLGGSGSGNITGTFTAYQRFVDRMGNFSSLSPISNEYTSSVQIATVTSVSYTSPMTVTTSAAHGLSPGDIVFISGVIGNTAANDTWEVGTTPTGTTFTLVNSDGSFSEGDGIYVSGGIVYQGADTITYDNVDIPTESKVVRRQILRNKAGESSVYYIDIDTTDLVSTSFTSPKTSLDLTDAVSLFDINGNTLVDKSIPPNYKKLAANYLGRMFASGNEPYSEGAVKVTNGSVNVTGIGTEWNASTFVGRYLNVVGGDKIYLIDAVSSGTALALSETYAGTTNQYAYYTITDGDAERRTMYWSEPAQPEAWPFTNQVTLQEDQGAGEITGLMPYNSWMHITAESRIYRFSFLNNPLNDGYSVIAARRGCINNRCWVQTEDTAFMLDYRGIHAFSGNDDSAIGSVEIQDLFRPNQTGKYKLNWRAARTWHCVYDPGENIIRWYVTMAGCYTPFHALCFHVRLTRWWIENYPFPVASSCLGRLNGKPQVFVGSDNQRIFAINTSTLDGLSPTTGTVRGTVTSAGRTWIVDSTASFPTSNTTWNSLTLTQGRGKGQTRRIVSISETRINVDQPWLITPDDTTVYQIGGVNWKWKGGWNKWIDTETNSARQFTIQFRGGDVAAGFQARVYEDFSKTPNTYVTTGSLAEGSGINCLPDDPDTDLSIDTTKQSGYVFHRMDSIREAYTDGKRVMALELSGTTNADLLSIQEIKIDGVR